MKYPALDPKVNLRSRIDSIDYDYISKLNPKEKEFLNKFTEEYINASFKKGKRSLNKNKKEIYNKNNARNRCVYTKLKAYDNLTYIEDIKTEMDLKTTENFEDDLNTLIDVKNVLEVESREEYEKLLEQFDQFENRYNKGNRRRKKP